MRTTWSKFNNNRQRGSHNSSIIRTNYHRSFTNTQTVRRPLIAAIESYPNSTRTICMYISVHTCATKAAIYGNKNENMIDKILFAIRGQHIVYSSGNDRSANHGGQLRSNYRIVASVSFSGGELAVSERIEMRFCAAQSAWFASLSSHAAAEQKSVT